MNIVLRSEKGVNLTSQEVDSNFSQIEEVTLGIPTELQKNVWKRQAGR